MTGALLSGNTQNDVRVVRSSTADEFNASDWNEHNPIEGEPIERMIVALSRRKS
jgi:hypothetical protein